MIPVSNLWKPAALGCALMLVSALATTNALPPVAAEAAKAVMYKANDGRTVQVDYFLGANRVEAVLWDGRRLKLGQAVSASGARYSDGQWTVWNKGRTVMVVDERSDVVLFEGVEQAPPAALSLVAGSKAWFAHVDALVRVGDSEGHGPDVGSLEWMGAVSRKLFRDEPVPEAGTKAWYEKVHKHLFPTVPFEWKPKP